MSSSTSSVAGETFLHHLAVVVSRSLNTLNPNEVLAARLFQLSTTLGTLPAFTKAISSFGKFSVAASQELWELCQAQDTIEHAFQVPGLTITDHDVLLREETSRPGLSTSAASGASEKHVFKAPNAPRTSSLGLDKLAADKRRERSEAERGSSSAKRIKYDQEDQEEQMSEFKSESVRQAHIPLRR